MKYQADYLKAVQAAEAALRDYGDTLMPLRLELLIDRLSNEIKLIPYTRFMAMHRLSVEEVISMLDSDLGACVYKPDSCQYLILYNDLMQTVVCRFTIGHELGHIFLKHHEIAGSNILSRTFVPKQQYEEFEKEANAFARNLLAPASLANIVNKRSHNTAVLDICRVFFISPRAAQVRIEYIKRDLSCLTAEMISFFTQFHAVRQAWICHECQTPLLPDTQFCPMCGSSDREWGYAYEHLPANAPAKPTSCPKCGNTHLQDNANYCHICGLPLENVCDGGHINPSYAHYCVICGDLTRNHLLQSTLNGGVEQMEYGPKIPYDENTLRVKSCPKCLYKKHLKDASFCIMCGTDLYNRCISSNYDEEEHSNPPNARFCYICGKPTSYSAFLPAFTELIAEQKEQFNKELAEADISPALHNRIIGTSDDPSEQPEQIISSVETDELPF